MASNGCIDRGSPLGFDSCEFLDGFDVFKVFGSLSIIRHPNMILRTLASILVPCALMQPLEDDLGGTGEALGAVWANLVASWRGRAVSCEDLSQSGSDLNRSG